MIWAAFGVGLLVGVFVGFFTLGLCQMAAKGSRTDDFDGALAYRGNK